MAMDPGALLVGPRGRRLCLEASLAPWEASGQLGDELRMAAVLAAYDLDPGRGTSRVMHSVGGTAPAAPPTSTPADVAILLLSLPVPPLDDVTMLTALGAAVDNARYWQEPDGEDVLAASPQMRDALARVAASLAGSAPAWWTAPVDQIQWSVAFADTAAPTSSHASAARRLASWRTETVHEESVARAERPRDPHARVSGTWWSTPPAELTRTTRGLGALGPVGLWLVEDAFGWDRATARPIGLPPGARVYELDGPDAWAHLCQQYPLDVTAARRHDWFRTTGHDSGWVVPDWSGVAAHFDAVHLSVVGYLTTAGRVVAVADEMSTVLAGWDPDATYWLSDAPPPDATEQTWTRSDDDVWQQQRPDW
jgi:hypothetical protein